MYRYNVSVPCSFDGRDKIYNHLLFIYIMFTYLYIYVKVQQIGWVLPASRTGNGVDIAQAILFAICCQYINSITIPVNGGYLIQSGQ